MLTEAPRLTPPVLWKAQRQPAPASRTNESAELRDARRTRPIRASRRILTETDLECRGRERELEHGQRRTRSGRVIHPPQGAGNDDGKHALARCRVGAACANCRHGE